MPDIGLRDKICGYCRHYIFFIISDANPMYQYLLSCFGSSARLFDLIKVYVFEVHIYSKCNILLFLHELTLLKRCAEMNQCDIFLTLFSINFLTPTHFLFCVSIVGVLFVCILSPQKIINVKSF